MSVLSRKLLLFALSLLVLAWAARHYGRLQVDTALPPPAVSAGQPDPPPAEAYYADVSVHTEKELELLFDRVEAVLDRPRGEGEPPLVSLVLHGPEVEFFALKNYPRYKSLVDRAARLAALGAVDLAICQTRMRQYGIGPDEVPAFLRQVPYGPGEIERLRGLGRLSM
ncbi:MAG TPA: hypothetical protein ENJ79_01580 [Gammaproteobacteria bacterium]|nr:hypothetical protein [Gammaproteobacteria bacterium]